MSWDASWPATAGGPWQLTLQTDDLDYATAERAHVGSTSFTIAGEHHTAGDDVQDSAAVFFAQLHIASTGTAWINPATAYATAAPADPADWTWTIGTLYAAAGIFFAGYGTDGSYDSGSFHAEYPYEINELITYLDPESDDPIPIPARLPGDVDAAEGDQAIHTGEGRVYRLTAGAWVLLGNVGMFRPVTGTRHTFCTQGDYVNHTTHNEIYRAMNLMRWRSAAFVGLFSSVTGWNIAAAHDLTGGETGSAFSTGLTWADAQAAAIASRSTTLAGGSGDVYSSGENETPEFAGPYGARFVSSRTKFRTTAPAGNVLAWSELFLVRAGGPPINPVTTDVATFDANGVDVVYHQWHQFDAVAAGTTPHTSVLLGKAASYTPTWCASPVGNVADADETISRGYSLNWDPLTGVASVIKFDVAGGLSRVA
jgi:hypothetical protein